MNAPSDTFFSPKAIRALHREISEAIGEGTAEVHFTRTKYGLLLPNGNTKADGDTHVFVEWHERPFEVKVKVAQAIHRFLTTLKLDSNITFRDSRLGSFFVNGELVGEQPA
jgi:phage host-nuclease inhibitor protein Gam